MRGFNLRRPSGAMVVASAALFIALGGTGYAAFSLPKNSVGTKQLKNGAVTTKKIKNGAVTAAKIKTSGLTVPNAVHANTANTAANATNATNAGHASNADNASNASHANEATVGDSPIAWAEVASDGSVLASRGLTGANVTKNFLAGYCFHGLSFPFKSAAVTPDYGHDPASGLMASFAIGDPFGDCGAIPGTQAEVATSRASVSGSTTTVAFTPGSFFVQFFN